MITGFIAGTFDLLHAGHMHLLKECKDRCDYLVVGLHVDPHKERKEKHTPIESVLERQIQLEGCKYVSKVLVYETEKDLSILLKYEKIDIRFLGTDYYTNSKKPITEKTAVPLLYIDSLPIHTSDIRERIKNA